MDQHRNMAVMKTLKNSTVLQNDGNKGRCRVVFLHIFSTILPCRVVLFCVFIPGLFLCFTLVHPYLKWASAETSFPSTIPRNQDLFWLNMHVHQSSLVVSCFGYSTQSIDKEYKGKVLITSSKIPYTVWYWLASCSLSKPVWVHDTFIWFKVHS